MSDEVEYFVLGLDRELQSFLCFEYLFDFVRSSGSQSVRQSVRLAQSALGHSIFLFFILKRSGSVSGQSQVSLCLLRLTDRA